MGHLPRQLQADLSLTGEVSKYKMRGSKRNDTPRTKARPFLKWPGGKRWLSQIIAELTNERKTGRYYEPFLGGGATFFALQPKKASLSDINQDLIETYLEVREKPLEVAERLSRIAVDSDTYYRIRSQKPQNSLGRAVRFLYLNRTAFAGIYRENHSGEFNVPFGGGQRTPRVLWETDILVHAAEALKSAKLTTSDFEPIINKAGAGDIVYCDPTYWASSGRDSFRRYNGKKFSWADQEHLLNAAIGARHRGALVIVSNACSVDIDKLYVQARKLDFSRMSCLSRKTSARQPVRESLFVFDPD